MSARDPILSSSSRQSELTTDNYLFLSTLDYPVCLRSSKGDFIYSNHKFSEAIKGHEYDEKTWFDKLPSYIQIELLKCEIELLTSSDCVVMSKVFNDHSFECIVLFQRIYINDVIFSSWLFVKNIIYTDDIGVTGLNGIYKGKPIRDPSFVFEVSIYRTFCLFFTGFSHEFIADVLGVSINASKKRISKCYQVLGIENKDEMILYLRAGSYLKSVHNSAFKIISERYRSDLKFIKNMHVKNM